MAPLGEVDKYNIASIALYFVTFVASLLMTIWLLCFIRRRSDPARHWVSWLNGCFAVFTLYLVLLVCSYILSLVNNQLMERGIKISKDSQQNVVTARAFIIAIYWILRNIVQILIFMTLVTLDVGIAMSRGGSPATTGKYLRRGAVALCLALLLITVISFGLRCSVYAQQYSGNNINYYRLQKILADRWLVVKRINLSYCIVFELLAIFLFGLASWSRLLASDVPHTKKASTYAVICASLLVTQTTYDFITYIKTVNFQDTEREDTYIAYLEALDIIFNVWTWFALLCTLVSLSNKKVGGVWATGQQFMARLDQDNTMTRGQKPWGYIAYQNGSTSDQTSTNDNTGHGANRNAWGWSAGGGLYYQPGRHHHVQNAYGQRGLATAQHVEMTGQIQYQHAPQQVQQQYQYVGQYQHQQQQQQPP